MLLLTFPHGIIAAPEEQGEKQEHRDGCGIALLIAQADSQVELGV